VVTAVGLQTTPLLVSKPSRMNPSTVIANPVKHADSQLIKTVESRAHKIPAKCDDSGWIVGKLETERPLSQAARCQSCRLRHPECAVYSLDIFRWFELKHAQAKIEPPASWEELVLCQDCSQNVYEGLRTSHWIPGWRNTMNLRMHAPETVVSKWTSERGAL
jgi:hypothetical protein